MADESWHLDKRVPIALIFALVIQFLGLLVGGLWFAAKLESRIDAVDARVSTTDRDLTRLTDQVQTVLGSTNQQAIQLGRIEEGQNAMRTDLNRVLQYLERRP